MIVATIMSLLEKLLQHRESDRLHVHDKCLIPLKQEVGRLHQGYYDRFTSYRHSLKEEGITPRIISTVTEDVGRVLSFRTDVLFKLEQLQSVTKARLGNEGALLADVVRALNNYLFPIQLKLDLSTARLAYYNNPSYQHIGLALEDGDLSDALATVDCILSALVANYAQWQRCVSEYEKYLCQ